MKELWLRLWISYYRASTYGTLMWLIAVIAIAAGCGVTVWSLYEAEKKNPGYVTRMFKDFKKLEE